MTAQRPRLSLSTPRFNGPPVAVPCNVPGGRPLPRALTQPTKPGELFDAETVIHRLEEAGHTLLSLPQTGHTTKLRQTRHDFVRDALEAFAALGEGRPSPAIPPAHRITRMDQAFSWIPLIPGDKIVLRRIAGCRCLVSPLTGRHLFSWRRLARLVSADHKAIQRWHASAIDHIVAALRTDQQAARLWDAVGVAAQPPLRAGVSEAVREAA